jgi:hypothetical protein
VIIADVQAEMATKLGEIEDLRVMDYEASVVHPPTALISLPDKITYDANYARGADDMVINVLILVSKVDAKNSTTLIRRYADGAGARSVKAALDDSDTNTYESCAMVTVVSAEFGVWSFADIRYRGVEFTVDISGRGN